MLGKMPRKMLTKKDGITLTALVITVVVLIILATVTLTMTLADDGIVQETIEAKKETEKGQAYIELREHLVGRYIQYTKEKLPKEEIVKKVNQDYNTPANQELVKQIVKNTGESEEQIKQKLFDHIGVQAQN